MLSKWLPFLQIETASVGDNFGGSRWNNDTKGGGSMFWTNRNKVQWVRLILRHHVVRLVGIVEHTRSMKA
jgi:hypothetical protein